jgi:hypothetical protein
MIFFKKIQEYIVAEPLNEMFSLYMLYKNKNIIAKLKNQNCSLIQDGDENIFLFFT